MTLWKGDQGTISWSSLLSHYILCNLIMRTSIKVMHWLPRIICILAILFVSLFAADAFEHGETAWQKLGAFFMHLIPSFILITILVVAWKWEFVGGIIFILIGLIFSPIVFNMNYRMNQSVLLTIGIISSITIPFIVIGALFIISHQLKKKYRDQAVSWVFPVLCNLPCCSSLDLL